jgi:hypothetical protein
MFALHEILLWKNRRLINKTRQSRCYYSDYVDLIVGNFDDFRPPSTLEHSAPALNELIQQSNHKTREILEELLPTPLRHLLMLQLRLIHSNELITTERHS